MNELMSRYGSRGFTVVGFPCNQFGYQENFGNADILNVLKYIKPGNGFVPAFPLMQKGDVNGETADPVWQWIRQKLPYPSDDPTGVILMSQADALWKPVTRTDVMWNFDKILFDRRGQPYKRVGEPVATLDLIPDIEKLINQPM